MKTYQINSRHLNTSINLPGNNANITIFDMLGNVIVNVTEQNKELKIQNSLFTKGIYVLIINYMKLVDVCMLECE